MALLRLVITGAAGSEVKVSCSVEVVDIPVSVTVSITEKLPSRVATPEMSPVTGSAVSPGGSPEVLSLAAAVAPLVRTWKINGLPVRPVELVPLTILIPEIGGD